MKTIEVSAAIIISEGKIFITQRGYGEFKDMWEFPGGKLEQGETGEQAIVREIKEELNAEIIVKKYLNTVEYTYPTFHIVMHNYICELKEKHLELLEAEDAKFVCSDELDLVNFLPADLLILSDLKSYLNSIGVTK